MLFTKYITKKRNSWILAVFIALIFAILSVIPDVYRYIGEKIYASETARYGSYHFIWYNMPESYVNRYRRDDNVRSIGFLYSFGRYSEEGEAFELVLGHADEEALRLGSITLLEGTWPKDDSEIVLEEIYEVSGYVSLGDVLVLKDTDGIKKEYRITGFISSYSHFLETTDSNGNTDLCPNALVSSPEGYDQENCNVYIEYDVDLDPVADLDALGTYMTKLNNYSVESFDKVENSIFHTSVTNLFYKCISMRDTLSAYIFVFYLFALFFLFTIYLREAKEDSIQLYRVGAKNTDIIINLASIMAEVFIVGIILGLLISVLIRGFILLLTDIEVSVIGGIGWCFWMFLGLIPVIGIYVFSNRLYTEEIMFTEKWGTKKLIRAKSFSVNDLARYDLRKNLFRYLILAVFLSALIVMFIHFDYQVKETEIGLDLSERWINISAGTGDRSVYNGVKDYVSIDEINSLCSFEGVDRITKGDEYGGWKGYTVLKKGESEYVDVLIKYNQASPYKGVLPEELDSEDLSILYNFNNKISFHVIRDSDDKWLKETYPQIDLVTSLSDGKVVVIASRLRNDTYTLLPDKYYDPERSFSTGRAITVIYKADAEKTGREYIIESYEISDIIKDDFISAEGDRFDNQIHILMSEETASKGIAFPAVTSARVYLKDDISEQQYGEIMKVIMKMTETGVHARYYTSDELNSVNRQINTVFYSSNIAVFALILCIVLYLVITFIYLSFTENRKMYGILRSSGMDETVVKMIANRESLLIAAVTFVISVVISVVSVFVIENDVAGIRMTKEILKSLNLNECITVFVISLIICGLITLICSILLKRLIERYFRESIASMIRFRE